MFAQQTISFNQQLIDGLAGGNTYFLLQTQGEMSQGVGWG